MPICALLDPSKTLHPILKEPVIVTTPKEDSDAYILDCMIVRLGEYPDPRNPVWKEPEESPVLWPQDERFFIQ